jgi:protocatechuate 3,4-dioxygenase beta subunit
MLLILNLRGNPVTDSQQRTKFNKRPGPVDLGRRLSLAAIPAASISLMSTPVSAQTTRCRRTEDAGEGPFYFDPDLVRSDISENSPGAPLDMALRITRSNDCAPLAAARVDLWHANGIGLYSGYEDQPGVGDVPTDAAVDQVFLRGTQFTDADGWVRFRTIYPSWYGGRAPHVHFKVWLDTREVLASQVFFTDEVSAWVFERFDPYREYVARRTVFNDNDPFHEGVYGEVEQLDTTGIRANATVTVSESV